MDRGDVQIMTGIGAALVVVGFLVGLFAPTRRGNVGCGTPWGGIEATAARYTDEYCGSINLVVGSITTVVILAGVALVVTALVIAQKRHNLRQREIG